MNKKISFIDISYEELESLPVVDLEKRIKCRIEPYFERIPNMSLKEKIKMREDVKNTRKMSFRFSQEITKDIPKERIQMALSYLAKLFRILDIEIRKIDQRKI
ncbi:hypothetical protein NsoK4_07705 [Nitrosopumilus sp. K4]|uniref:hypothetical protein n=1 Tax=Nitrosopumilus sp. K4 TaxID=2795383 RepID=UPI001BAB93A9|nr:hypothetical protein [Nitrosopumilus sp. K4]QUC64306.1 hypothetical protein NsoK4_07705 [Nitrosopumilus sp. K4]